MSMTLVVTSASWRPSRYGGPHVRVGGGVIAHIKLSGRPALRLDRGGKQVNAEARGAVGFAPRWLAQEIEPRRIDQDRACPFASN
jgi:uncharacterized protein